MAKRRQFSAALKAKVALEAFRRELPLAAIAKNHDVHSYHDQELETSVEPGGG